MTLDQVFELAAAARALTQHPELVVIGSNSILGGVPATQVPAQMSMSIDLDAYLRRDPGRTEDLTAALGENSAYHLDKGVFLDVVSPRLLTAPEGWEARMNKVERDGLTVWFLEPVDAAISKLARGEARDLRWVRGGLSAGIFTIHQIRARLPRTPFLDMEEAQASVGRLDAIEVWLVSGKTEQPEPDLGF